MQMYIYDPIKDELVEKPEPQPEPEEYKIVVKPKPRKARTKHEIYGDSHPNIELIKEVQEVGKQVLEQRGDMTFTYAGAHSVNKMNTYDLCKEIIRWAKIDISRGKNAKFVCLSLKSENELETKRQYQRKHYHERRMNNDL